MHTRIPAKPVTRDLYKFASDGYLRSSYGYLYLFVFIRCSTLRDFGYVTALAPFTDSKIKTKTGSSACPLPNLVLENVHLAH